jgi:hypothetical protein
MPTRLQVGGEEFNTVPLRLVQPIRTANRQLLIQECALDSEAHSYMLELSSRPDPLRIGLFHSYPRIPTFQIIPIKIQSLLYGSPPRESLQWFAKGKTRWEDW